MKPEVAMALELYPFQQRSQVPLCQNIVKPIIPIKLEKPTAEDFTVDNTESPRVPSEL